MLKMQLDPNHWCVVRTVDRKQGERSEGAAGLKEAFRVAAGFIDDYGVRRVLIFDGQPSDGAKVVAVVDLDGEIS